ncbi:MDR family MFS transporter [Nonomuraea turcica]|uniref:MDR family MFS transporter n=1 Tax=Nonomuraea sp. G32 TaxID=3067274 RepID=UPI00273C4DCF|nr:MDR family MFS transporter [Nonomuraea sp. G32]MDP4511242.1 MDR family MFS transporter [Nonomuraea sp. G32]
MTAVAAPERLDPALLKLATIVVAGALASLLNTTILSVAIDGLGRHFDAPLATVQWVATAYLLAMAMAIPLTGWSVQRFGAKTMWMSALSLFLAASVLCGLAWSIESLIAFRVLQGLAGGMILPLAQTILAQAAGPSQFGRVMALVAIPGQLAPIIGPVLGGVLIDGAGWRWVFFVNVPVVGLALLLAWRAMPSGRPQGRPPLDLLGLVLLSPGLAALVYGLAQIGGAGGKGFGSTVAVVILMAGVGLVAAFARHALRTRTAPLLDLRLFRHRSYTLVTTLTFLSGASIFGPMFLLPLYYQQVHGLTTVETGLMLAPQGIGTALSLLIAGRLNDRIGARPLVLVGLAVTVAATIPFTLSGTGDLIQIITLLIRGMGLGIAGVAMMAGAYQGLRRDQIPGATGLTNVVQRVGGSLGTAVLAVVLQRVTQGNGTPAALEGAFGETFWWTVGFALLALIPSWLLPRSRPAPTEPGTRGGRGTTH